MTTPGVPMSTAHTAVIGAGFGGLAAALTLAEQGQKVVLFESLRYPGGCASTFEKGGARYETGATLFSGLGPGGLFERWRQQHDMDVAFTTPDVPITLRSPSGELPIPADRDRFITGLCALPNAPEASLRRFFRDQGAVAEALWPMLDDPGRLVPFGPGGLSWHVKRLARYLPLIGHVGRPALHLLARHGLADWRPLRTWVDACSQITVQASAADAEAPFALSTLDYTFRGTGHIHGGIGVLAKAMVTAIRRAGGTVHLASRVRSLTRSGAGWRVAARGHSVDVDQIVGNVLPDAMDALLGTQQLGALDRTVSAGWAACMLYLRLDPAADIPPEPHHLQLIADEHAPLVEGNHIFVSISGADEDRAPDGQRTATISTHIRPERLLQDAGQTVHAVHNRMQSTLRTLAPEVDGATVHRMTASPRTWSRFTGRSAGRVGGVPRTVGLHNYGSLGPQQVQPGARLVGDSVFPGQSTLATALGGAATARAVLRAAPR